MKRRVSSRQYGSTILPRGICHECGDECFICGDMTSSCCNAPTKPIEGGYSVQEVSMHRNNGRRSISEQAKKEILDAQENKCFWCGREFGMFVISPKGIVHQLNPVWDHYIPYAYTHSCKPSDFVAACQRCNAHKAARIITSDIDEDKLRETLKLKWYSGGWQDS